MINKKMFIMILCCGLSQTYWTCVSDDKGRLLDAPMGIQQDDILKPDIYIDGCDIDGLVDFGGGNLGAKRNVTQVTLSCHIANLNDKSAEPEIRIYISANPSPDLSSFTLEDPVIFKIGPRERREIIFSGLIIGDEPAAGTNYIAVYADLNFDRPDQKEYDLSNNWSEPDDIWIED
ncbi:MAG: hypothetical protein MUC95_00210 [Spirochaetes bacterium]|nr:hypothetical protein [Spirochaetota bacterium]